MATLDQTLKDVATDEIKTIEQLYEIQSKKAPSNVMLPYAHNVYDIDLNTRTIYGPEMLAAQKDHKSDVIYFRLNRYFDYMDLVNTVCIIEYIIPGDKRRVPYVYIVPFFDTTSELAGEGKMIFPWAVAGAATQQNGTLEYAIRFFKISDEGGKLQLVYNLNTLPAKTVVKRSLEVNTELMNTEYDIPVERYQSLIHQLATNSKTTWMILE